MTPKLYILRGLPCTGKTSEALTMVKNDPWLVRVSRKDIMKMSFGVSRETDLDRFQLDNLTLMQHNTIDSALKAGLSVIDDNHNLAAGTVKDLYKIANKYKAEIEVINHHPASLDDCIKISKGTKGLAHDEAFIRNLIKRFTKKGKLNPEPKNVMDIAKSGKRYEPNPNLPKAVWVDADGTFFTMSKERYPFDFHLVHLDTPQPHIVDLCKALQKDGYKIVVMSGRDEICYDATYQGYVDAGVIPDDVFMRPNNTSEIHDYEIKHELFWKYVAPKYDIRFALDDRQSVVDYTREVLGIPVLQVAPGDF